MRATRSICLALASMFVMAASAVADRPSQPRSGREFQSPETQALETDEAANPGYLWIEDGRKLWQAPAGAATRSCASCHGAIDEAMSGVAARFPRVDVATGALVNLEGQINACRTQRQQSPAYPHESAALLGLTALLAFRSRGQPRTVVVDGAAAPYFEKGRALWSTRQGQLDVACSQCHDDNVGKRLRGDRISQGQSDGWPAYRLEWQAVGSLQRRLRACSLGVRAEVLDFGAPEYLALELYLAWRGEALPVSVPGVRR